MTSAGKDVEKLELWETVGGNAKWCSSYGKKYGGSLKNLKKKKLQYDSAIILLDM